MNVSYNLSPKSHKKILGIKQTVKKSETWQNQNRGKKSYLASAELEKPIQKSSALKKSTFIIVNKHYNQLQT